MANVGFATLTVIPSMKGFQSKLATGVAAPMGRVGSDAGKKASGGFRTKFLDGMKGIAAPLAGMLAVGGAIDFLKGAVDEASGLAESGNKISVVFGPAADNVNKFARDAADNIGQSELEARNAAATFGIFGKSAGLTGGDLSGFSTRLTTLASDFASFYDASPEEAITAIGSALRGESEPIRQFGILLDDATLRNAALREGLISTTSEALTPQQKVLAAYSEIMRQSKDAQGDFSRTSESLANRQRTLKAQWSDMKSEVGERLLPVMTDLTAWATNKGLPMLKDLGGFTVDAVKAMGNLPGPVKTATTALIAFKAATSFFGFNPSTWAGKTRTAMDGVRLRTMEAKDAYQAARTSTVAFNTAQGQVVTKAGRTAAAMSGLKAATAGIGTGMKSAMGGMVGALGGPWGLAIAGGVTALTLFASKHQQAAADAEALRATLNQQTGALTTNSREWAANKLADAGFIDDVAQLGLNASSVTAAMLGQGDAANKLTGHLEGIVKAGRTANYETGQIEYSPDARAAQELLDLIKDTNGTLTTQRQKIKFVTDAMSSQSTVLDTQAEHTRTAADAQQRYRSRMAASRGEVENAEDAVLKLVDAYNKQADAAVQSRRDQVGLEQAMADAAKEARKGKRSLNESTQAGRDNWNALLDLADQWNNSTKKVQNARGAHARMKKTFIDTATAMGASRERAEKLAKELLNIPKKVDVKVEDKGINKAQKRAEELAEMIRKLRRLGRERLKILEPSSGKTAPGVQRFASGGKIGGSGSGTSDSNLLWGSKGEWMIRARAARHYGDAFMSAVNNLQLPKMAGGGPVGGGAGGVNFNGPITVVAHDYGDFMRQMQRRTRQTNAGGVRF